MKAMRAHQFGGPEQLRYEDAPDVLPQAGQVQIRVRAAGINPADLVRLSGRLQPLALPYIPGTDVCGEVEAVGSGVGHVKPGDRVFGRLWVEVMPKRPVSPRVRLFPCHLTCRLKKARRSRSPSTLRTTLFMERPH
jgi:NADPH:quinone reductase-like Zn-dependent oxidoreductase